MSAIATLATSHRDLFADALDEMADMVRGGAKLLDPDQTVLQSAALAPAAEQAATEQAPAAPELGARQQAELVRAQMYALLVEAGTAGLLSADFHLIPGNVFRAHQHLRLLVKENRVFAIGAGNFRWFAACHRADLIADRLASLPDRPLQMDEVATALSIGYTSVRRLIEDGELPSHRFGNTVTVPRDAVAARIKKFGAVS
ncbi:excisionase family DNA-binding protein [Streptosporangium sp. NPDC002524]|uniref:excisionase family DNA-binding protein n=1 Tax=Streptosporangium sp. NPDC002524 TaxID=3154537 RepID=UPI003330063D